MREFQAPGRVNLIGDHIDYMGGTVLPMAIDRGTRLRVESRTDGVLSATSENFPEVGTVQCDLTAEGPNPDWAWANYLVAVAHAFRAEGLTVPTGLTVEVVGNIPNGSGLSSSASLELAFAVALNALGDLGLSPVRMALLGQAAENHFIGVSCGIMDQLAIAAGRAGHALAIDCGDLTVTDVPFPDDVAVVVANTNRRRELAGSAYNDRRGACEAAQAELDMGPLVRLTPEQLPGIEQRLDAEVAARVRHVITEQWRVLEASRSLAEGDVARVGALMRQSHESLRDDFDVTGPYLDALASAAWSTDGVIGARMTGAGFGGCTVNLIQPAAVPSAIERIGAEYRSRTGLEADFYVVRSDDGAREVRR